MNIVANSVGRRDWLVRPARAGVAAAALAMAGQWAVAVCPADMVSIDATYCVDRHEASLDAQARSMSIPGVMPKVQITQPEAAAACKAAGKRLCTDTEWLRACRGPNQLTYPYGNTLIPGRCNDEGRQIAPTGSYAGCVTAEGAFDMVGNVNEWTADPAGTFRGGYYGDIAINGPGCLYRTTAHDGSARLLTTGFRCCADDDGTSVPILRCSGFESPMNQVVAVKQKNRVLPLKMQLLDSAGLAVTPLRIGSAPLLEVVFGGGGPATVPENVYLQAGQGDEGNVFTFNDYLWQFNLQTKNFGGAGSYTIRAISGNPSEYEINPRCQATFVINP